MFSGQKCIKNNLKQKSKTSFPFQLHTISYKSTSFPFIFQLISLFSIKDVFLTQLHVRFWSNFRFSSTEWAFRGRKGAPRCCGLMAGWTMEKRGQNLQQRGNGRSSPSCCHVPHLTHAYKCVTEQNAPPRRLKESLQGQPPPSFSICKDFYSPLRLTPVPCVHQLPRLLPTSTPNLSPASASAFSAPLSLSSSIDIKLKWGLVHKEESLTLNIAEDYLLRGPPLPRAAPRWCSPPALSLQPNPQPCPPPPDHQPLLGWNGNVIFLCSLTDMNSG